MATKTATKSVYFGSPHFSPTFKFEDGSEVQFNNYGLETENPKVIEKIRKSIFIEAGAIFEKKTNPLATARGRVSREKQLEEENARLSRALLKEKTKGDVVEMKTVPSETISTDAASSRRGKKSETVAEPSGTES